jgi:hypothetical protein
MAALAASSELVPPNVAHVVPFDNHQLVAYSVCSPEHCWNTFYLRKIQWTDAPKVVCRRAIAELNEASDFIAEKIERNSSAKQLKIHMVSSHEAFQPQIVTLKAYGDCQYELGELPTQAAN